MGQKDELRRHLAAGAQARSRTTPGLGADLQAGESAALSGRSNRAAAAAGRVHPGRRCCESAGQTAAGDRDAAVQPVSEFARTLAEDPEVALAEALGRRRGAPAGYPTAGGRTLAALRAAGGFFRGSRQRPALARNVLTEDVRSVRIEATSSGAQRLYRVLVGASNHAKPRSLRREQLERAHVPGRSCGPRRLSAMSRTPASVSIPASRPGGTPALTR